MNRILLVVCLLLVVVLGGASLVNFARPMPAREIRMGLQVFSGVEPLVLAHKLGYYGIDGAAVRLQRFTSLYDSKRAFSEGKLDATTMTVFDAILLADQGVPFKIVLVVDYTKGSNAIVAQKGIATIKELCGKRVGVTAGAALHSVLLAALQKYEMREADVAIVNHPPDRLAEEFLAGKLDAASLVDPFLAQVLRKNVGRVVFSSEEIPQLITDVLIIRPDLEQLHPGAAAALVRGYFKALDYWKANEPEAIASMAESSGLASAEFTAVLKGILIAGKKENEEAFGVGTSPGSLHRTISQWDQILIENGYLGQPSNLAARLDDRYVREALP